MSEREDNRKWLTDGAEKWPGGWEALNIAAFGIEGALDLLMLQSGNPYSVDLRHRPFASDSELKFLVSEARLADQAVNRRVNDIYNEVWTRAREGTKGSD